MAHSLTLRVYYEDTDLAGIVYYANYLKFIERARTEWVRGLGLDQRRLQAKAGLVFAVRHLEADYLRAARFDDLLRVETRVLRVTGARIQLAQDIFREAELIFAAKVMLVCLTAAGQPARLPAVLARLPGSEPG